MCILGTQAVHFLDQGKQFRLANKECGRSLRRAGAIGEGPGTLVGGGSPRWLRFVVACTRMGCCRLWRLG